MPRAGYEVSYAGGLAVVTAPVEIDASNAAEFRQALSCASNNHLTLVVDMSETVFCDSTGLHQLIRAHGRAVAAGGEVRLVIRAAPVLRLFAIMGIDGMFPVFATLAEAAADGPARPAAPASRVAQPCAPG